MFDETPDALHEANVIREFVRHPGFTIFKREVEKKIADSRNEWLKVDKEKAEEIRLQAKSWGEVFDLLKRLIIKGDAVTYAQKQKE